MAEATGDPYVVIIARKMAPDGTPFIVYETIAPALPERWVIAGTCNQCGQCEVGGIGPRTESLVWVKPVGEPGAVIDPNYATRLDLPVRPELKYDNPACSLRGRYISGGLHQLRSGGTAAALVDNDVPKTMR